MALIIARLYNVFRKIKTEHLFYSPGNYQFEVLTMLENLRNELQNYINQMDEYQLRFTLSLIKKVFRLPD